MSQRHKRHSVCGSTHLYEALVDVAVVGADVVGGQRCLHVVPEQWLGLRVPGPGQNRLPAEPLPQLQVFQLGKHLVQQNQHRHVHLHIK